MPDTVDARIPLQIGQNLPSYGPNWNAIAQMQKQQMLQQQAQQEIQARNVLKQFYSDPSNFDDKGIPSTQKLNALIGMSPAAGEVALGNTLKAQQFGNQNALRQSTIVGKMQTDAAKALETANGIYKESMASGMSEAQAKQRAQEYWTDQRKALTAGQSPEIAQSLPSAFDPIMAGAVGITNEQRLTNERLEKSGYKLEKQQNPGGGVSQIWVKAGAPSLDMGGNPVTPTGMPAPTAAEAKPEYVGSIKGEGSKVDADVPLLYQNGAWIDSRTNKPVPQEQLSGIRKMGTESSNPRAQAVSQYMREHPDATAEEVADYQRSLTAPRSAPAMFMQKFMKEHPNADSDALAMAAARYRQAGAMEQAFGSGSQGNTIRSLNVAIDHTDVLKQLGDALKNNDVQKINALKSRVMAELGYEGPVNFDVAKKIVADEVIKAVLGNNVGTGAEREAMQKDFDRANSPEQLNGVVETARRLMLGQMRGLEFQYAGQDEKRREDFRSKLFDHTKESLESTDKGASAAHRGSQEGHVVPIGPAQQAAPAPGKGGTFTLRKGSEQADYDSLPSGAEFTGPDGKLRKKP